MSQRPAPSVREKLAWCLFDFANSSYTTVILTVVYARYFVGVIIEGDQWHGLHEDTWWAAAGVISNLVVIFSAPIIGALADRVAGKKRYLLFSTIACVVATASLSLWGAGMVIPALVCVILATTAFSTGENLIAGFLPELAKPDEMGRLSAYGWTIGYFGGLGALGVALFLVESDNTALVPAATAAFFALAALPTFVLLSERASPVASRVRPFEAAFGGLRKTWRERRRWRDLFTFLGAILLFQGGVYIVVSFAAIYAEQEIGMADTDIILMFIALQVAAALGAYAFGFIQDHGGSRRALLLSLAVWIAAVLLAWQAFTANGIWVAGMLAGVAMGSSQSASRALVGMFCPPGREGEWFGLWGLATKASAVLGLAWYGILMALTDDRRFAILMALPLFVGGLVVLAFVNPERGRAAAANGITAAEP